MTFSDKNILVVSDIATCWAEGEGVLSDRVELHEKEKKEKGEEEGKGGGWWATGPRPRPPMPMWSNLLPLHSRVEGGALPAAAEQNTLQQLQTVPDSRTLKLARGVRQKYGHWCAQQLGQIGNVVIQMSLGGHWNPTSSFRTTLTSGLMRSVHQGREFWVKGIELCVQRGSSRDGGKPRVSPGSQVEGSLVGGSEVGRRLND